MNLRPYQTECVEAVEARWRPGGAVAVGLPTGAGKTVIACALSRRKKARTLFLVHRDVLVDQAVERYWDVWPEARAGVVQAAKREWDRQVVVASVQSVTRDRGLAELVESHTRSPFHLVITDECHHAVAESYLRTYRALTDASAPFTNGGPEPPYHVGFSATLERGDGAPLKGVYEAVAYQRAMIDLIPQYLCDLRGLSVPVPLDWSRLPVLHNDREYEQEEVEEVFDQPDVHDAVVRTWAAYLKERRTLAFCTGIQHSIHLVEAFQAAGVRAAHLDGETPQDVRRKLLSEFREGRLQVLGNAQVLTEGYDDPSLDGILLVRPVRTWGYYVQIVGRGARPWFGKKDCLVLDVVGDSKKHQLVKFQTLTGREQPPVDHEDGTVSLLESARYTRDEERTFQLRTKGGSFEIDLYLGGESVHWLRTRAGWRIASLPDKQYLVLRPDGGHVWPEVVTVQGRAAETVRLTTHAMSEQFALGVAQDWLTKGGVFGPTTAWRRMPPTEPQVRLLQRLGERVPATRGEASDLISLREFYRVYRAAT